MKTLFGSNFKMHVVLDETLVPSVIKNLQNRFGEVLISGDRPPFIGDGTVLWDAGGSIMGNDIKFSFKVSEEISILCRSQHWEIFKKTILDALQKEGDEPYLKLHSQMFSLCLSEDQAGLLMTQIMKNSCKFNSIADVTLSRMPSLEIQGV